MGSRQLCCLALRESKETEKSRARTLGWFSGKRPRMAWFSRWRLLPSETQQVQHFRARQTSRQFCVAAAVLQAGGHVYCEWLAKTLGWSTVELRDFRAQQQRHGRQLHPIARDTCRFAKRENFWNIAFGKISLLMFASRNIWVLQCQSNHSHTWRTVETRGREYPAVVVRRLVNGFVHDLRPPQLHMFLTATGNALIGFSLTACRNECSGNMRKSVAF